MIRQYELVERVKAYDPDADEDLLNRAYVFAMKAHGSQLRAPAIPTSTTRGGRRHPDRIEARQRLDRDRPAARHGRGHGRDAGGDRAAVRRRRGAAGRRRHQALPDRAAVGQTTAKQAENFRKLRAGHVGGYPRPAGQAGRPRCTTCARCIIIKDPEKRAAHRRRDDGDLCAAGRAHRHGEDARTSSRICPSPSCNPDARASIAARACRTCDGDGDLVDRDHRRAAPRP